MELPSSPQLPIDKLAGIFKNTSATYKYYWFLSIIDCVESGDLKINKKRLFAKMISQSWFTVNYFNLSFGMQDKFHEIVQYLLNLEGLTIDQTRDEIESSLVHSKNRDIDRRLGHLNLNVPHWFLSPWFPNSTKSQIYALSKTDETCIYSLYPEHIEINPKWYSYLKDNAKILKDFGYWNLTLFLQVRNPNVPDIASKINKPIKRNSLKKQKAFWKIVFSELGEIDCIFTKTPLSLESNNFEIDHFVPHAFVSHDLMWNLIPIEKRFNSVKSDKLPSIERHFNDFCMLQNKAFEIVSRNNPNNKFLEDYYTIFHGKSNFQGDKLKSTIEPLITIAQNNGFYPL